MKVFNRASLPNHINYNKGHYRLNVVQSAKINSFNYKSAVKSLEREGFKFVVVKVLSSRLKGVRDLHGKFYNPSIFIFTKRKSLCVQKK